MAHIIDDFVKLTSPQTHHFHELHTVSPEILEHVRSELRMRGAVEYDLWLPETHYLPHILHKNERIMGSVYGKYDNGRGALIATDQRVLFIDRKPLFMHVDELTFAIIGGVTFTSSPVMGYVTLHTRLGNYELRTFNLKNAANFVDYIETKCVQQTADGAKFESTT